MIAAAFYAGLMYTLAGVIVLVRLDDRYDYMRRFAGDSSLAAIGVIVVWPVALTLILIWRAHRRILGEHRRHNPFIAARNARPWR